MKITFGRRPAFNRLPIGRTFLALGRRSTRVKVSCVFLMLFLGAACIASGCSVWSGQVDSLPSGTSSALSALSDLSDSSVPEADSLSIPEIGLTVLDFGAPDERSLAARRAEAGGGKTGSEGENKELLVYQEEVSGTQRTVIQRKSGQETEWTYYYPSEFFSNGYLINEDGIYVYGTAYSWQDGTATTCGILLLLDNGGQLIRETRADTGNIDFHTAADTGDGILLFGRRTAGGNEPPVQGIAMKYDNAGKLVFQKEWKLDSYYWAKGTAFLDGSYFINYSGQGSGILVSVTADGKEVKQYPLPLDGRSGSIEDMAAHGGKLYLSCLCTESDETEFASRFGELSVQYYEAWETNSQDISGVQMPADYREKLSKLFRSHYSAVLLICGPDASVLKSYGFAQAQGGPLGEKEGKLYWHAYRIDTAENALPFLSSRRFEIASTDIAVELDPSGNVCGQQEGGYHEIWY